MVAQTTRTRNSFWTRFFNALMVAMSAGAF
jgi:hypothetical protein